MSLKDELKAIQDKKNVVDRAIFEHIVHTISEDLKHSAKENTSTFVHYWVEKFTFSVPLHKDDYLPGEKPFIEVSVEHVADLKRHFESEGITVDGAWARSTGDGCLTFSWG